MNNIFIENYAIIQFMFLVVYFNDILTIFNFVVK
jgi:hypothetical protein